MSNRKAGFLQALLAALLAAGTMWLLNVYYPLRPSWVDIALPVLAAGLAVWVVEWARKPRPE